MKKRLGLISALVGAATMMLATGQDQTKKEITVWSWFISSTMEKSIKAFVHYPANTFPGQDKKLEDNTHFSPYGAYELARCIVSSIQKQNLPLAKLIRKDVTTYDPAQPLAFEKFYWPQGVLTASSKPDGNAPVP